VLERCRKPAALGQPQNHQQHRKSKASEPARPLSRTAPSSPPSGFSRGPTTTRIARPAARGAHGRTRDNATRAARPGAPTTSMRPSREPSQEAGTTGRTRRIVGPPVRVVGGLRSQRDHPV
jgi:hypothetical protein